MLHSWEKSSVGTLAVAAGSGTRAAGASVRTNTQPVAGIGASTGARPSGACAKACSDAGS